jgi:toxin YhaV
MFEAIPVDPTRPEYRQGGTLGANRKHWFRAKFGGGRFRLFFRYSTSAKIIIFAWVNDAQTLRTYGSKSDAYAVFKAMLDRGNPPEDWAALIAGSSTISDA